MGIKNIVRVMTEKFQTLKSNILLLAEKRTAHTTILEEMKDAVNDEPERKSGTVKLSLMHFSRQSWSLRWKPQKIIGFKRRYDC